MFGDFEFLSKYNLTLLIYFSDLEESFSDIETRLTAAEGNIQGAFIV